MGDPHEPTGEPDEVSADSAAPHRNPEPGHDREDLTGEHRAGDAGQIVLLCLFLAVWLADSCYFKTTTSLNQRVPLALRLPVAGVLLLCAGYLAKASHVIVFGERRDPPQVISKGVFKVVRHPMYLSEILFYLALLLVSISLAAAAVWVVGIVFFHHIARHEERLLLARFGQPYAQYREQVPMWIPRLGRK